MDLVQTVITDLRNLPADVEQVEYRKRGYHLDVALSADQVRPFAQILRERGFYLVFVSAVHATPAIEVIYQFAYHGAPCRLMGRASLPESGSMDTISDIFHGADWHERETKDMFGVLFSGHPCLEPLLLPEEDADLKPLLKAAAAVKPVEKIRWVTEVPPAAPQAPTAPATATPPGQS